MSLQLPIEKELTVGKDVQDQKKAVWTHLPKKFPTSLRKLISEFELLPRL